MVGSSWEDASAESAAMCCPGQTACSPGSPPAGTAPVHPRWPALPLYKGGTTPRPTDPSSAMEAVSQAIFPFVLVLAFSRGEGELSDSFSQSGNLVWKCVLPTATDSIVLHSPAMPGASLLQSKSWGQAWDTNGRGRRGAAPHGGSAFVRPITDHEPSQVRKWEQKNRGEEQQEEGMPEGKLPDPAPCSSPHGLFKGNL